MCIRDRDFLDMIAPAAIKFNTDHFILGSRYHTAMTLKSYPPMPDELALLRGLGDMGGVNPVSYTHLRGAYRLWAEHW